MIQRFKATHFQDGTVIIGIWSDVQNLDSRLWKIEVLSPVLKATNYLFITKQQVAYMVKHWHNLTGYLLDRVMKLYQR